MKDQTLEELAEIAKKAQRDYDTAMHERSKEKQEITAISTPDGFSWNCTAVQPLIIKHTKATILSAFDALKDDPMSEVILSIEIMESLKEIVKTKSHDS